MARFCVVVTLAVCCLITGSNGSKTWLSSTCFYENECPAAQKAMCQDGECLCTYGYYYSEGQKTCVKECAKSDLQRIPLIYRYTHISGPLIDKATKPNAVECWKWCISMSECRASVYNFVTRECTIPKATGLSFSSDRWSYDWECVTHILRCA